MEFVQDYRREVRISLSILKKERSELFRDISKRYSVIFEGLHEISSETVRALYFQAYFMEWLDRHWTELSATMNDPAENLNIDEKKNTTLFFARYFTGLIDELCDISAVAGSASQPLLKAKKRTIEDMISFAGCWEEKSNQLKVDQKKHKAHFLQIIEHAKKKEESE